jgi:hypothetical protein
MNLLLLCDKYADISDHIHINCKESPQVVHRVFYEPLQDNDRISTQKNVD